MMFTTTRPAVAALAASFDRTGATTPPALAKAFTRRTGAVDRFANRPLPAADALPVAVLAAIEAGIDPATDTDVRRITTAAHLSGIHNLGADVESILLDAIRAAAQTSTPYLLCRSSAMLGPGKSDGVGMAQSPLSLDGLGGVATGTVGCDETSDGTSD